MSLQRFLKITLTMVNDHQVNVQLRNQGFDISDCNTTTDVQFTAEELSVAVRALEINRALSQTFDETEWQLLKQWNVVRGEFEPTEESGEIRLCETEIDVNRLIKHVQEKLFYMLFPKEERAFEKQLEVVLTNLNRQQDDKILHIRLEIPSEKENEFLHQFPWEILCIKCEHFGRCRVSIARYIQGVRRTREIEPLEQTEILVVRSRPSGKDFEFVQLATEQKSIWQRFQKTSPVYRVRLNQLPDIRNTSSRTETLLSDYLDEQRKQTGLIWFLHFECHGSFGRLCLNKPSHVVTSKSAETCPRCGANVAHDYYGYLAFEYIDPKTPPGESWVHWFSADALADLLAQYSVDFVFLNTCNSAAARRSENVFNGIAQALIRAGVPAVIGTPFPVESEGARQFAQHFYHYLFQSGSLIGALDYARQRLVNDPTLGQEWYRFALYFGYQTELPEQVLIKNPSKNLSGQDLSGQDLRYEALCGWNLENANLSNADLSRSLLTGANLRKVNLTGATLTNTNLSDADLTGANLANTRLAETILENARLVNTILTDAEFFKKPEDEQGEEIAATLKKVNFNGATLANADFFNTKLSDVEFKRSEEKAADLTNANFSGAEFTHVHFDGANLANAKFNYAAFNTVSFRGANLTGADFQGVNFEKVKDVDFSGADLTDIQVDETFSFGKIIYDSYTKLDAYFEKVVRLLSKQDSPGIDLAGTVHLKQEDLSRPDLDLSRANFCGADLRRANLGQVNLQGADLSHTKLRGVNLYKAKLNRANLSGAKFYDKDDDYHKDDDDDKDDDGKNEISPDGVVEVELCGADLQGADLSETILHNAQLIGANLQGAKFIQSELTGANLTRANLKSANMTDADLSGADLIMADLSGADLRGVNLQSARLIRSDLTGAQLQGVNLNGTNLYGAILGDIELENFDLSGATLPDGTKMPDDTADLEAPAEALEAESI